MSLEITVAAPFRHMRKGELRKSEFIFFLAIDRKWMNRDQAETVITLAGERGLLAQKGGVLTPLFDPADVTIPLGFKPSSEIFEQRDVVQEMIERVAAAGGMDVPAAAAEMNDIIQKGFDGNLRPEAAVVILARRHGAAFEDMLGELESSLRTKKE